MADLTGESGGRDRGQIVLLTAFILAAAFVILALVVNAAIFTENLATRDDVPGSQDALEYRSEVEVSAGNVIETTNKNESLHKTDAENSIENISQQGGIDQSGLGRIVNVTHSSTREGIRIAQDNVSRNFTSTDPDPLISWWAIASNVEDTRNFEMNITNPDDSGLDFKINLVEDILAVSDEWNMTVSNVGGDDIEVTVERYENADLIDSASCTRSNVGSSVTIDITGGTVNGSTCHALNKLQDSGTEMWFGANMDHRYSILFHNPETIEGTYSFVVDEGANPSGDLASSPNPDAPYGDDDGIIYSMFIDYHYFTPHVGYETEIRVAPGEAPP